MEDQNTKRTPVHTIMTHYRPHLDEIVGIAILQQCGQDRYPGIENATYAFCDAGDKTPDGRSWKKWHEEGTLLIGVGGSCFDEHPTATRDRKEDECAATLVAKHLGIDGEPWLEKLLKYTTANDLKGGTNPFDLGAMVNRLNKQFFEQNPSDTVDVAVHMMVMPYLAEQMNFFLTTKDEFEKCAEVIPGRHMGKPITVVACGSDNNQMGAYARSTFGANADVVIQKNSKGNVIITTKSASRINLTDVIVGLRGAELNLKGIPYNRKIDLTVEGKVEGAEEWHYNAKSAQIFNGSASAPNTPPTKIVFDAIVDIVGSKLANAYMPHENRPERKNLQKA